VNLGYGGDGDLPGWGANAHSDQFGGKHGDILVVFFRVILCQELGQYIWKGVGLPRDVLEDKVIFLQVSMPLRSALIQVSGGLPILEVSVVG
jgi:hypothetical protein